MLPPVVDPYLSRRVAECVPGADVVAWGQVVPWTDPGLGEQDLVHSDPALARSLALRGGTALHKLALVPPGRYSEDIDLVQTAAGPIGPLLSGIRRRLDPWLGTPTRDQAASSVTLLYRFDSEVPPVRRLRLQVEINTREHFAVFGYRTRPCHQAPRSLPTPAWERDRFDLWDALRRASSTRAMRGRGRRVRGPSMRRRLSMARS